MTWWIMSMENMDYFKKTNKQKILFLPVWFLSKDWLHKHHIKQDNSWTSITITGLIHKVVLK